MKILLLGATGRTGKLVLKAALKSGHKVTCLARNSGRIQQQNGLTIIEGNVQSKADLEKAISHCDSIINVLNISRKSDFPWAGLKSPETLLSDVMSILVPIAVSQDIKRISICSAWGAAETKKDIPGWFRWLIDHSNVRYAYREHERQEHMLSESMLNWTIVRPVGLSNSKSVERIKESYNNEPKPGLLISRQSTANFLVDSLSNENLIGKKVVISKE